MKSKIVLRKYRELLKHMKYYNKFAPFPVFDTEYVEDLENKIKEIMNDKLKDYDDESVVACKHCKSLHVVSDEIDNTICMRCGAINELQEFENIYEYQKYMKLKNE